MSNTNRPAAATLRRRAANALKAAVAARAALGEIDVIAELLSGDYSRSSAIGTADAAVEAARVELDSVERAINGRKVASRRAYAAGMSATGHYLD